MEKILWLPLLLETPERTGDPKADPDCEYSLLKHFWWNLFSLINVISLKPKCVTEMYWFQQKFCWESFSGPGWNLRKEGRAGSWICISHIPGNFSNHGFIGYSGVWFTHLFPLVISFCNRTKTNFETSTFFIKQNCYFPASLICEPLVFITLSPSQDAFLYPSMPLLPWLKYSAHSVPSSLSTCWGPNVRYVTKTQNKVHKVIIVAGDLKYCEIHWCK